MTLDAKPNRATARREATRLTLISTAATLLSEGRLNATIQEITEQADVGVGTFYNHFRSRDELYAAAATAALDTVEAHMVATRIGIEYPAELVAIGIRNFGRMPDLFPLEARVLAAVPPVAADRPGLSTMFLREAEAAAAAGRFTCRDVRLTALMVAGAMNRLVAMRLADPTLTAEAVDDATAIALAMLGMDEAEADELAHRPLPVAPAT